MEHRLDQDYENYEILVLPDEALNLDYPKIRVIFAGHVGPSEKRDRAIAYSQRGDSWHS